MDAKLLKLIRDRLRQGKKPEKPEDVEQSDFDAALQHVANTDPVAIRRIDRMASPKESTTRDDQFQRDSVELGEKFDLEELIGGGGGGRVYRARNRVTKLVCALKIIDNFMGAQNEVSDINEWRKVASVADHHHVVQIRSIGRTQQGRPYIEMEFIDGVRIDAYVADTSRTIQTLVELLSQALSAVQHFHGRGIMHGDLKARNILVCEFDGVPCVKIVDFGISRAIDIRHSRRTAGERSVSSNDDQFSTEDFQVLASTFRQLLDQHDTLQDRSRQDLRSRELDSILRAGCHLKSSFSYENISDFVIEVERWQKGESVLAHKSELSGGRRFVYRIRRMNRRRLTVATIVLLVFVLLAIEVRRRQVQRQNDQMELRQWSDLYYKLLRRAEKEQETRQAGYTERALRLTLEAGSINTSVRDSFELRTLAVKSLLSIDIAPTPKWCMPDPGTELSDRPFSVSYAPSGRWLALACKSKADDPNAIVRVLRADDGTSMGELRGNTVNSPFGLGGSIPFLPDGMQPLRDGVYSLAYGGSDNTLFVGTRRGNLLKWKLPHTLPEGGTDLQSACRLLSAKAAEGGLVVHPTADGMLCVTFSPTGEENRPPVRVWETGTLRQVGAFNALSTVTGSIGIAPDGSECVISEGPDSKIITFPELSTVRSVVGAKQFTYAPNNRDLVAISNATLQLFDRQSLQPVMPYSYAGQINQTYDFSVPQFSMTGELMACINRTLNHTGFWAPYASDHALILPSATNSPLSHFAFAPDERHFCLCSHDGVRLYELKMKREFCSAVDIGCMAYQVAVAPNGATVAIDAGDRLMQMDISGEGGVSPLNAELGSRSEFARHDLCYSADNQWLVTSGGYGNGQISIVAQGQRDGKAVTRITLEEYRGIYDFKPNYMAGFGWNDSGFLIAAASGQLLMWDLNGDTPQEISRSVSNGIRYRAITLSGREGFAVATDDTGATLIQRLDCSNSKISLTGHYDIACPGAPTSCTSSPSGTTLVVGDDTGAITVADVTDTPSAYQTIDGHDGAVCDVVWCGNSRVVSGAADGLTVWGIDDDSLAPEYQIPVSGAVSSVAVSPDGARVFVTCTGSSLVREIDIEAIDRKLQELGLNSEGISVSNLHSFE